MMNRRVGEGYHGARMLQACTLRGNDGAIEKRAAAQSFGGNQLLHPQGPHIEDKWRSGKFPDKQRDGCRNIRARMNQPRLLSTDFAPDEPDHPQHRQRRRDDFRPGEKALRQPANAKRCAFTGHGFHARGICPVFVLFVSDQRNPVIARQPAQIGEHLALSERLQKAVAGNVKRVRFEN